MIAGSNERSFGELYVVNIIACVTALLVHGAWLSRCQRRARTARRKRGEGEKEGKRRGLIKGANRGWSVTPLMRVCNNTILIATLSNC